MGGREPGVVVVERVFLRLRLLIKTSLRSDVLLPVLMRIKKPKSVCACVVKSLRVWVCACRFVEVLVVVGGCC